MTPLPDSALAEIRARCERAIKALEVGGIAGAFLCAIPLGQDVPALLAAYDALTDRLAKLEAAAKPIARIAEIDARLKEGESTLVNISRIRELAAALAAAADTEVK